MGHQEVHRNLFWFLQPHQTHEVGLNPKHGLGLNELGKSEIKERILLIFFNKNASSWYMCRNYEIKVFLYVIGNMYIQLSAEMNFFFLAYEENGINLQPHNSHSSEWQT